MALRVVHQAHTVLQNHVHAHTTALLAGPYQVLGVIRATTHAVAYLKMRHPMRIMNVAYL